MKKLITVATAGLFLLSLQGVQAQKEVEPPAVPPMLEGPRPLAQPETKEPAAPKKAEPESQAQGQGQEIKTAKGQKRPSKKTDKKNRQGNEKAPGQ
jgi:hypothetical protein